MSCQSTENPSTRKIEIPRGAMTIIEGLQRAGHEAYVVGGCVRDSLLGITPHDWDICTSATPQEMQEYFSKCSVRTIDTGLQHGTITVDMDRAGKYEVTTFRIDGAYSDNRRPDSVEFTADIKKDLSRRDFTINAMAYNQYGLVDPFQGEKDLEQSVLRCVGDPNDRFQEDSLRILRALRFAVTHRLSLADGTAKAIHDNRNLLQNIAAERIQSELRKMLCELYGEQYFYLMEYQDVIGSIIPELKSCMGFEQNNKYHHLSVYGHIALAVTLCRSNDFITNMALLLHDIGKPHCYTEDHNGGHFHGHAVISRDIAEKALINLRVSNQEKKNILDLVMYHDAEITPTPKSIRKWLNRLGERQLSRWFDMREADLGAHAPGTQNDRLIQCASARVMMYMILEENQCFRRKHLKINGRDVMDIMHLSSGRPVGEILDLVLEQVISGELPNDRGTLIQYLKDSTGN